MILLLLKKKKKVLQTSRQMQRTFGKMFLQKHFASATLPVNV